MFFLLFLVTQTSKKLSLNFLNKHSVNITGIIFVHNFEAPFTLVRFRFKTHNFYAVFRRLRLSFTLLRCFRGRKRRLLKKLPTPYQFETSGVVFQCKRTNDENPFTLCILDDRENNNSMLIVLPIDM